MSRSSKIKDCMRLWVAAIFAACAMPAAAADCVTSENLAGRGILFKMSDGKVWHARAAGQKGIRLEQANGQRGEDEIIEGPYGVYEVLHAHRVYKTKDRWGQIERDFAKRPPKPVSGKSWSSNLQEDWGNFEGVSRGPDYKASVHYRFLPMAAVDLGGCSYDILAVEATFTGKDTIWGGLLDRSDRWIYFPDLGVGVHTMSRDGVTGKDTRAGITGLSAAQ